MEVLGLISGLLCVWLLIRENVLTFPIGLIYAVLTVVVVYNEKLYADVFLNIYYVGMNAYGWFFWLRGGGERRGATSRATPASRVSYTKTNPMVSLCLSDRVSNDGVCICVFY